MMTKKKKFKPVVIVSKSGHSFLLLDSIIIQIYHDRPYMAQRVSVARSLRSPREFPRVPYAVNGGETTAYGARLRISPNEIAVGCQHFKGRNSDKLRKWAETV